MWLRADTCPTLLTAMHWYTPCRYGIVGVSRDPVTRIIYYNNYYQLQFTLLTKTLTHRVSRSDVHYLEMDARPTVIPALVTDCANNRSCVFYRVPHPLTCDPDTILVPGHIWLRPPFSRAVEVKTEAVFRRLRRRMDSDTRSADY